MKGKNVFFKMLTKEGTHQLLQWLSKVIYWNFGITWFIDSVQASIFVAEHEGWLKKECKFIIIRLGFLRVVFPGGEGGGQFDSLFIFQEVLI